MHRIATFILLLTATLSCAAATAAAPLTERRYLSGKGPSDAVEWDFTVSGGRRAGEQAKIPVPSHWEQHGFGVYNYGQTRAPKLDERGVYRRSFTVPAEWKGKRIRLVFEGVMTDATVTVNGVQAGPTHQGAFTRFHYDITKMLKFDGENELQVEVAKASSAKDTNRAERYADYWIFGGIFRPVWLEASPIAAIDHVAIDARADGSLTADTTLLAARTATHVDAQLLSNRGEPVGAPFSMRVSGGGASRLRLSTKLNAPRLWTAETPNLYHLRLTLMEGDTPLHQVTERFGFRTFEVRPGKGLYLNGQRILLKGVNRHAFRPQTGRALDPKHSYEDVRLIRSMNMNAVRMSHYPPDKALLEAADEIGLYVLNELSGWQHAHDTHVGRLLVRELVERDVNHPSILFWDNGNEGGWNRELDREFALYDPQQRRVLHPWELHDDVDTKHYPTFPDLARRLAGQHLVMPTEVLHGLYDGGHGAGLEDYWNAIARSPAGAGAFLWSYADEGIARSDQGGRIDVVSTYAPDGIFGPNLEREGSYFTIRDLWSPVQIKPPVLNAGFDGILQVENRYDFTSLEQVRFNWRLLRFAGPDSRTTDARVLASGTAASPAIAPHADGPLRLALPRSWTSADALALTALAPDGEELWSWTWPTLTRKANLPVARERGRPATVRQAPATIELAANGVLASFDAASGALRTVMRAGNKLELANGPRLTFAKPGSEDGIQWLPLVEGEGTGLVTRLATAQQVDQVDVALAHTPTDSWSGFKLELSDGSNWRTIFDGSRRTDDGTRYRFAPQLVTAIRISQPVSDQGRAVPVKAIRIGHEPSRYPAPPPGAASVTTGSSGRTAWLESSGVGFEKMRWTMHPDGTLQLDYRYPLEGEFHYHGITFDYPMSGVRSVRTLSQGPFRSWQNRLRGTTLAVHDRAATPRETRAYPEFEGYFAGLRWARFQGGAGQWLVASADPKVYLRIGTPLIDHANTTAIFPPGDVSFLHAIPAIGSKFVTPANSGPGSQPAKAGGVYDGRLYFKWSARNP